VLKLTLQKCCALLKLSELTATLFELVSSIVTALCCNVGNFNVFYEQKHWKNILKT